MEHLHHFNLKDDPAEENDLSKKEPEKLEEMKKTLFDTFAKIPSVEPYGGMKLRGGGKARGPMGPEALTSERYVLYGDGQVR